MVMLKSLLSVPIELAAVTVTVKVPDCVGFPLNVPLLNLSPVGNVPVNV